jgi:hypothetical protein
LDANEKTLEDAVSANIDTLVSGKKDTLNRQFPTFMQPRNSFTKLRRLGAAILRSPLASEFGLQPADLQLVCGGAFRPDLWSKGFTVDFPSYERPLSGKPGIAYLLARRHSNIDLGDGFIDDPVYGRVHNRSYAGIMSARNDRLFQVTLDDGYVYDTRQMGDLAYDHQTHEMLARGVAVTELPDLDESSPKTTTLLLQSPTQVRDRQTEIHAAYRFPALELGFLTHGEIAPETRTLVTGIGIGDGFVRRDDESPQVPILFSPVVEIRA